MVAEDDRLRLKQAGFQSDEIQRLLTMFDRGYKRGDGFESSVKLALKAVLINTAEDANPMAPKEIPPM